MLLTKEVEVNLCGSNIKHFESKNYLIPRVKNKAGRFVVQHGTRILVKVEDLPIGNETEVEILCDYCQKETIKKPYINYIKQRKIIEKDCCDKQECINLKRKESLKNTYGVENQNQVKKFNDKRVNARKDHIEKVYQLFLFNNLIPLFYIYDNTDELLPFKCKVHNDVIQYASIKQVKYRIYACPLCETESMRDLFKHDENKVFEDFKTHGLIITPGQKYINSHTHLECECEKHKGIKQYISYFDLLNHHNSCKFCIKENRKIPENNPNWKGGITSENHKIRSSNEYKEWRQKVFERDNYTCQCCGDNKGGNLQAHHKESFSTNEELRFDVNNGITLCDKCHDFRNYGSFHHVYGAYDNTKEQLEEYILRYKNGDFDELRRKNNHKNAS